MRGMLKYKEAIALYQWGIYNTSSLKCIFTSNCLQKKCLLNFCQTKEGGADARPMVHILLTRVNNFLTYSMFLMQWKRYIQILLLKWVCLFPNSNESVNPNELKFRGTIPLGCRRFYAKNLRIHLTVSRKIKKN